MTPEPAVASEPEARPPAQAPSQCERNEVVDRRVFEEIDAVGEQRHRLDRKRDGKFDAAEFKQDWLVETVPTK